MLQHNHWGIDGWVPLQNIGAPGLMYTRHRMSQRSTDTSDRIYYSLLQCYYLPPNVRCFRDSLSVTEWSSLWIFSWQNLHRIFFGDISKKITCSKFLPHAIRGPISSRGPLRTCVPCLMVNPALQSQPHSCDVSTLQTVLNAIST